MVEKNPPLLKKKAKILNKKPVIQIPFNNEKKNKNVAESRIPPVSPEGKGVGGHGAKRLNPASQNNCPIKENPFRCPNCHKIQFIGLHDVEKCGRSLNE